MKATKTTVNTENNAKVMFFVKVIIGAKKFLSCVYKLRITTRKFNSIFILMIPQNVYFRTSERYMIKALVFINGYSLKNRGND
jgi:hypothetical protein